MAGVNDGLRRRTSGGSGGSGGGASADGEQPHYHHQQQQQQHQQHQQQQQQQHQQQQQQGDHHQRATAASGDHERPAAAIEFAAAASTGSPLMTNSGLAHHHHTSHHHTSHHQGDSGARIGLTVNYDDDDDDGDADDAGADQRTLLLNPDHDDQAPMRRHAHNHNHNNHHMPHAVLVDGVQINAEQRGTTTMTAATTSASVTAADEVLFTASASSTADLSKTSLLSDPLLSREFIVAGGRWRTVSYHELPDWLKDNELILNHHRPQLFTFAQCIESIFRIHSETGNIWTHLVGWLAFLAVCVATFSYHLGDYPWEDHACFAAFFVGLLVCLSMSTTFHTVCCHSVNVAAVFSRFDYAGISMLIVGSTIPFLYYAFKCNTVVRYTYTGICVFLGTACIIISILPRFDTPRFRVHRMVTFLSFGVSGIVPGIHCIVVSGFMFQVEAAGIGYMLLMGALYITGAVLYAARIPERFFPGKCDLIFQSHQIFHVLVLAAASVHFYGLLRAAEYHHTHDTCVA